MPGRVSAAAARNATYFPGPQCRPHRQPGPCLLLSSQSCLYQVQSWHLSRHYPVQTEWQWGWWCWRCLAMAARYMGTGWNFHNMLRIIYATSHLCYVSMLNHTFAVIDHTFSLLNHTFFPLHSWKSVIYVTQGLLKKGYNMLYKTSELLCIQKLIYNTLYIWPKDCWTFLTFDI